jgi:hypothetical protein
MAITREKSTGGVTPATVSRNGERGRRLREEGDDTRGPHGSEGRERAGGTGSGRGDAGPRLASGVGPNGFPGSVSIFISSFLFFFFCFLYFFISFSNLIQIDLNQLCKVSKIQHNNPEQYQTCFHN